MISLCLALTARAHHGLDFMVLQDGTLPHPGSLMVFNSTQWSTFNGEDEWGTEPGVHLGVTPWLAIGTTASILDEGSGWHYSSTTPYLNVPLFKSDRVPWLKVSFYAGYEFPDNAARARTPSRSLNKTKAAAVTRDSASTATSTASSSKARPAPPPAAFDRRRHTSGGTTGSGPDAPTTGGSHDHTVTTAAPPPTAARATSSTASAEPVAPVVVAPMEEPFRGIHRHGEEGLHARLIIDIEVNEHDKLLANVINFTPAEGSPAWGYALGYRHAFTHDLAASLEAIGDFDGRGSHEVIAALHCTLNHTLTLKLGAGAGLTRESPDASVHAGVVWRF